MLDAGDGVALRKTGEVSRTETSDKRLDAKGWRIRMLLIVVYIITCFLFARYGKYKYQGVFRGFSFALSLYMVLYSIDRMILVPQRNRIRAMAGFMLLVCLLVWSAYDCMPNYTPTEAIRIVLENENDIGRLHAAFASSDGRRKYIIVCVAEADPEDITTYTFDPWSGDYSEGSPNVEYAFIDGELSSTYVG